MKKLLFATVLIASLSTSYGQCSGYAMNITFNNPTCFGFCDGSLTVQTTGGNGGETYTITDSGGIIVNPGGVNASNNLCDGWYFIHVIDMMGCVLQDSVQLIEPLEMIVDATVIDALCFDDSTGSITIDSLYNPTGNPNFVNYFWNPNPNNVSASSDSSGQVPAGMYTLTVNDENGCSAQFDFTVSSPPALYFTVFSGDNCINGNDGFVYMAAGGGVVDYDYVWTDLTTFAMWGATTWGGLNAGCYEGWITDNNGCELKDTICIGCLGQEELSIDFEIFPNPITSYFQINVASTNYDLEFWSIDGRLINIEKGLVGNQVINATEFESGTYVIVIRSADQIGQKQVIIQ